MELGKHTFLGAATGSPFQPIGRHRDGIALIPLGDRHRSDTDYHVYFFAGVLEERDSIDPYAKFLR